jgi:hypothetical protein
MQQRQLRLGDILDDYCPRERRLTNHAVVAMIGDEIRQTRCTTCEAEHEYKHARIPRQRRKSEEPAALYSQVLAGGPKRVAPEPSPSPSDGVEPDGISDEVVMASSVPVAIEHAATNPSDGLERRDETELSEDKETEEGPVHRQLIRATLPRQDGSLPARPAPDFTIRQPGGRQNRFRSRNQRGGQLFQGNRPNGSMGGGGGRGGGSRQNGGRHTQGTMTSRPTRHHDPGRKRSK